MAILTAAVILVGAIGLLNLLLTVGTIRRLREHTELLAARGRPVDISELQVGDAPADYQALAEDGTVIGPDADLRAVAFFSTTCGICPERAPLFADFLRVHGVPRERAAAVVCGPQPDDVGYRPLLREVALVTDEMDDGPMAKAFRIVGYPAFVLLGPDGTVLESGYDPTSMSAPSIG